MSTLATTNIKHASSSSNNIVLDSNGKAIMPGHIIQVVQGNYANNVSTTETSAYNEISSDLRATITPISATSKLIITYNLLLHANTTAIVTIRILKDGSTTIVENEQGSYSSNLFRGNSTHYADADLWGNCFVQVIDTAGNTNQRYYTPFWYSNSGTRGINNYLGYTAYSGTSSYTIMEVAA